MRHFYYPAQANTVNLLLTANEADSRVETVETLGSLYIPDVVLLRIKSVELDDSGAGGYITSYIAVDKNGGIIRDANRSMEFPTNNARLLFFSELITINRP